LKTILVTAISGQVGHGILKCLNGYDGQIFGTDVSDYPVGMDRVSKCFKVPFARDSSYIFKLLDLCYSNGVSHLIPVNEEETAAVAANTDKFIAAGTIPVVLPLQQLRLCMDKYNLPKELNDLGILVPNTYTFCNFLPDGQEYIAKLRFSSGSRLVQRFSTATELEEIVRKSDSEIVIQQYIPSDDTEYTIGVFSTPNEIRSISFRRVLKNGYSQFVELADNSEFSQLAEQTAKNLNIVGCFNIQLRQHKGKNYIFEINPRISGTVYFRHQLGFEDVRWWLAYASDERILPYVPQYCKAVGIREWNEKFLLKEVTNMDFYPPPEKNIDGYHVLICFYFTYTRSHSQEGGR
jgi:carbamoyl-phosphate synthase large subunit